MKNVTLQVKGNEKGEPGCRVLEAILRVEGGLHGFKDGELDMWKKGVELAATSPKVFAKFIWVAYLEMTKSGEVFEGLSPEDIHTWAMVREEMEKAILHGEILDKEWDKRADEALAKERWDSLTPEAKEAWRPILKQQRKVQEARDRGAFAGVRATSIQAQIDREKEAVKAFGECPDGEGLAGFVDENDEKVGLLGHKGDEVMDAGFLYADPRDAEFDPDCSGCRGATMAHTCEAMRETAGTSTGNPPDDSDEGL